MKAVQKIMADFIISRFGHVAIYEDLECKNEKNGWWGEYISYRKTEIYRNCEIYNEILNRPRIYQEDKKI